jgi:hypothetical protein
MRRYLALLAATAALSCGTDKTNSQTTGPGNALGCAISGTWGASHAFGSGGTIAVGFKGDGTATFDRTGGGFPDVHVDGVFTYDVATGHVAITNKSVQTTDTAFDACLNVVGTYSISFSDCSHFTLTLVSDTCQGRVQSVGSGAVIAKTG